MTTPKEVFAKEIYNSILRFEEKTGVEVNIIKVNRIEVSSASNFYKQSMIKNFEFEMG